MPVSGKFASVTESLIINHFINMPLLRHLTLEISNLSIFHIYFCKSNYTPSANISQAAVQVCGSQCFVLRNFYHITFHPVLKYTKSKFKKKIPPYKKSVSYNVWENARFYRTGVVLLFSSSPWVSVPYEAKESGSGQSRWADFKYDISILPNGYWHARLWIKEQHSKGLGSLTMLVSCTKHSFSEAMHHLACYKAIPYSITNCSLSNFIWIDADGRL